MLPFASSRVKYIKRNDVFAECGEDLFYQPRKLPSDPKCIKIHNNVVIAADATFVCHDVIYLMLNQMDDKKHSENLGCIEIMDNCFIGLGAKIMPNVRIGPNAIIAAGSVVTKDVLPGTVVGGVPARVIGTFEELVSKQNQQSEKVEINDRFNPKRIQQAWDDFYSQR